VARAIDANRSMVWGWRKALRGACDGKAAPAITFAPVSMIPDACPQEPSRQAPPGFDDAIGVAFCAELVRFAVRRRGRSRGRVWDVPLAICKESSWYGHIPRFS
jgi:hypothetical protein